MKSDKKRRPPVAGQPKLTARRTSPTRGLALGVSAAALTSALAGPAAAQCVVTGAGTLSNLSSNDQVLCTGVSPNNIGGFNISNVTVELAANAQLSGFISLGNGANHQIFYRSGATSLGSVSVSTSTGPIDFTFDGQNTIDRIISGSPFGINLNAAGGQSITFDASSANNTFRFTGNAAPGIQYSGDVTILLGPGGLISADNNAVGGAIWTSGVGGGQLTLTSAGRIENLSGSAPAIVGAAAGDDVVTIAGDVFTTGPVAIDLRNGANSLTLNEGASVAGDIRGGSGVDTLDFGVVSAASFAGDIEFFDVFNQNGAGTVTWNGSVSNQTTNSSFFTVNTSDGVLDLNGDLPSTSAGVNQFNINGGRLNIGGGAVGAFDATVGDGIGVDIFGLVDTQNISNGTINLASNGQLVIRQTGTTPVTYGVEIDGAGSVLVDGFDVTLTNTGNGFSGGLRIANGVLRAASAPGILGAGPILVDIGGTLSIDETGASQFNRAVTGTGRFQKTGGGDLTVGLAQTYSGGTVIAEGSLIGDVDAFGTGAVDIDSGALLSINSSSTGNVSFANTITGAGAVELSANGGVAFNGVNSFSGGTTINSGAAIANRDESFGVGAVVNNAVLRVGAVSLANDISGSGRLEKTSAGVASLTGANTYSGGTDILGGALAGGASAFGSGRIDVGAGATFRLSDAGNAVFANDVLGDGSMEKTGAGIVDYRGDLSLATAGVDIISGGLRVNTADFIANVNIGPGGLLGGTGVVTGDVAVAGTAAPGNSIGTLEIDGDVAFAAGSTLEVEFDAAAIDLLDVSGAATIDPGANLVFVPLSSGAAAGGVFLEADGGVSGTFDNISVQGGGNIAVVYTSMTASIGQQQTGRGPLILSARPDHLSAEAVIAGEFTFDVADLIGFQMVRQAPDGERRLWGGYVGGFGQRDQTGGVEAVDLDHHGFVGGVDYPVTDSLSIGMAVGWTVGGAEIDRAASDIASDSVFLLATARTALGPAAVAGGFIYGDHNLETERTVVFNSQPEILQRETNASSLGVFARARTPVGAVAGNKLGVSGGVDIWRGVIDGGRDASSNTLALDVKKNIVSGARLEAGVDIRRDVRTAGAAAEIYAEAGARHTIAFDDRAFGAAFDNGAGPAVTLTGDDSNYFQGYVGVGATLALTRSLDAYADYDLGFSGEAADHAVKAGLRVAF